MSRNKRLLGQDDQQQGSIVKKLCASVLPDGSMKVPIVKLKKLKLELEHPNRTVNEHRPVSGSAHSSLPPPPPLAHDELLACHLNIRNNHHEPQDTLDNEVCTSPPKECSKGPVVRLFRLNIQTGTREREPARQSDRGQHQDQELQKTDQLKVPSVDSSYTSLEEVCRQKQPVVKLSRLKIPLEKEQLRKSSSEQYSDQVPSTSYKEAPDCLALSPIAQKAILTFNTDFTRKQEETKDPWQTMNGGGSGLRHDDVLCTQPENQEKPLMDDSDSDQFDEEDFKMLSAYEIKRLKNIKENAKFLKSLKLLEIPATLRPPCRRPLIRPKIKSAKSTRRSVRLQEKPSTIKAPEVIAEMKRFKILRELPHGPIKMLSSVYSDHGAWLSFQETWKSISLDKCAKRSSLKCRNLTSYAKSLQSLSLKKTAVTQLVTGSVCSITIHPSKTRTIVAVGDYYGYVGLWDLKNKSAGAHLIPLHSSRTSCVAFSPYHPQHLLTLGRDGTIRRGDIFQSVFDEIFYEEGYLSSFDFLSADVLLVAHRDSKLSVVDCRTRNTTYSARGCLDLKLVTSVSVHPLKRDLCVVAGKSNALIYDVRKLSMSVTEPVLSLLGHKSHVLSAHFSPATGKRVLTSSLNNDIRTFRPEDYQQSIHAVRNFRFSTKVSMRHQQPITWDPKQENCFAHSMMGNGKISILHVTGQCVHTLSNRFPTFNPNALAIHPTRNLLAAGSTRGAVCVWKKWNPKPNPPAEDTSLE